MSEQKQAKDVNFSVSGRTIAGQEWGLLGDKPVIALHGWLDNSASFSALAPQLDNVHLIALDMAGHGLSSYREPGNPYNIWQDVSDVFDIADQMQWQQFSLIGHSRGAMTSVLCAGTFPERISHLALIDGFRPGTTEANQAPQQLAKSIIDTQRISRRDLAIYPDEESAIIMRQRSEIPISYEMAKTLAGRGVKKVEEGFVWASDPQLRSASAVKFSGEQADAFIERITAQSMLIIANDGLPRIKEFIQNASARHPQIKTETLAGGHHLHMEDNVDGVAKVINNLLLY